MTTTTMTTNELFSRGEGERERYLANRLLAVFSSPFSLLFFSFPFFSFLLFFFVLGMDPIYSDTHRVLVKRSPDLMYVVYVPTYRDENNGPIPSFGDKQVCAVRNTNRVIQLYSGQAIVSPTSPAIAWYTLRMTGVAEFGGVRLKLANAVTGVTGIGRPETCIILRSDCTPPY